jgi:hypothetical protein
MRAELRTAGERVELTCAVRWISDVLEEGAAGQLMAPGADPDIRVTVEREPAGFDITGWRVLTRDAWCRPGQVIMGDACSSGLDLLVSAGQPLDIRARWRPSAKARAARALLPARSRLLLRAVLLQYPALWHAQQRGRAPLHASVCETSGETVLLAGPGGIGKTTLVHGELASGAAATCDNLCASDGRFAWGLVEPLRLPASVRGSGRRMPHGRRETPWRSRADGMRPDRLVVLVRGDEDEPVVTSCEAGEAARYLTAGTYMAGELRRYWAYAATLALGTGEGASHPQVSATAVTLSQSLPCLKVALGSRKGLPLSGLIKGIRV